MFVRCYLFFVDDLPCWVSFWSFHVVYCCVICRLIVLGLSLCLFCLDLIVFGVFN